MFIITVVWFGSDRWSDLLFFVYVRITSVLTHASLLNFLRLSLFLISFFMFPCTSVWENTRA